jgi:hypothetical protein
MPYLTQEEYAPIEKSIQLKKKVIASLSPIISELKSWLENYSKSSQNETVVLWAFNWLRELEKAEKSITSSPPYYYQSLSERANMKIQIKKHASGLFSTPLLPGQMFPSTEALVKKAKKTIKVAGSEYVVREINEFSNAIANVKANANNPERLQLSIILVCKSAKNIYNQIDQALKANPQGAEGLNNYIANTGIGYLATQVHDTDLQDPAKLKQIVDFISKTEVKPLPPDVAANLDAVDKPRVPGLYSQQPAPVQVPAQAPAPVMAPQASLNIQITKYASGLCNTPSLPGRMFASEKALIKEADINPNTGTSEVALRAAQRILDLDGMRCVTQNMSPAFSIDRFAADIARIIDSEIQNQRLNGPGGLLEKMPKTTPGSFMEVAKDLHKSLQGKPGDAYYTGGEGK